MKAYLSVVALMGALLPVAAQGACTTANPDTSITRVAYADALQNMYQSQCRESEELIIFADPNLAGFTFPRNLRIDVREHLYYPPALKRKGVRGTAMLALVVNAKGIVTWAGLLESSGNNALDEGMLRVARTFNYKTPAKLGDEPVATFVVTPITFRP